MNRRYLLFMLVGFVGLTVLLYVAMGISQQRTPTPPDAVQEAQTARQVKITLPEQQQTPHDQSDIFRH